MIEDSEVTDKIESLQERLLNAYTLNGFFKRIFEGEILNKDENIKYLQLLSFFDISSNVLTNDETMKVELKKLNFVNDHAKLYKGFCSLLKHNLTTESKS